jgi:YggT family protein
MTATALFTASFATSSALSFASLIPYPFSFILQSLVQFYVLLIILWAVLSWFNQGRGVVNDVYQVLDRFVSPFVNIFRRFLPSAGGMDFSPLVAILLLQIVLRLLL